MRAIMEFRPLIRKCFECQEHVRFGKIDKCTQTPFIRAHLPPGIQLQDPTSAVVSATAAVATVSISACPPKQKNNNNESLSN